MDYQNIASLAIRLAAPILLIAIGGLFSLRIGIFNLALEGFALMGCFMAVYGTYLTGSVFLGIVIAAIVVMLMALLYAMLVLEAKLNPIVCAIAFLTISEGLTRYLLGPIFDVSGQFLLPTTLALPKISADWLERIPIIGPILNNHSSLVYLSLILPFIVYVLLYKTKAGLSIRSTGQNAEAAQSAGIHVKRTQYIALAINGIICGLAGAQIAMSLNMFNVGMTDGIGFEALAVLTLVNSEPLLTLLAGLMFGLSDTLVLVLQGKGYVATQVLSMLPYVLALLVAIMPVAIRRSLQISRRRLSEKNCKGIHGFLKHK